MDPEVKGEGSAVNTTAATLSPERSLTGVPSYLKPVYQKLAAKVTKLQLSNKVRGIVRPYVRAGEFFLDSICSSETADTHMCTLEGTLVYTR